ncbi:TPA: 50S ribosomal protein L30e [Candidatus Micrarchaeota archaeon]|nr:50S ribosomal protein L30e [Candidatus Micrarchaeota archaeon]
MVAKKKESEDISEETTKKAVQDASEEVESAEVAESTTESAEAADEAAVDEPKKKLVRRRKSKREKESPVSRAIRLAVESGKVGFGSNEAMKKGATSLAFVLAGNSPASVKSGITYISSSKGVPIINFAGSSIELGSVCGKPYPVSVLSVYEQGSSNIVEIAKEGKKA